MKKLLSSLKKGLIVEVITGADKGKRGRILEIRQGLQKVKVQGVRLQKKHDKQKGIQAKEGFIDCSNVRLPSGIANKLETQKSDQKVLPSSSQVSSQQGSP